MVISKNLAIACVLTRNIERPNNYFNHIIVLILRHYLQNYAQLHVPVPSAECPYVFACLVMSLAGGVVASAALWVSLSI